MDPVHGKHHKGRTTYQDYKRQLRKRQSDLYVQSIPANEYCVTTEGQYRCLICPHMPPFSTGQLLLAHVRGKKHIARLMAKSETVSYEEKPTGEGKSVPVTSMAMPSLLYRTNAIKQRVLEGNRVKKVESKIEKQAVPPPSGEPEWVKKIEEEKEERRMIARGFRKNENGEWERDPMVEFDSDEEPSL